MSDPYGYPPPQHDQWAPPQPAQQWGPPPPAPKKPRKRWPWVVGGLVLVIIIAVAAGSGSKGKTDSSTSDTPAVSASEDAGSEAAATQAAPTRPAAAAGKPFQHAEDAAVISCARDPDTGWGTVKVRITNHSSKASNYIITVAFESPDRSQQYGTALVATNDLQPGQTTVEDSNSLKDTPAGAACRLTDVTRYAA